MLAAKTHKGDYTLDGATTKSSPSR